MAVTGVKHCPVCGKWTESRIPMAAGTGCTCLTERQKDDVQTLREQVNCHIIDLVEAFYGTHPELCITYTLALDASKEKAR
jgi:hypothetical protein